MDTSAAAAPTPSADAQQGASSPSAPGLTTAAHLDARIAELASAARAKAAPSTTPAPPAAAAAVPSAGVAPEGETAPVDASSTEEVKKEKAEKLIPQAVFNKRLGEVAAKRDAAIAEQHKLSHEVARLNTALESALKEADYYKEGFTKGKQYDPHDVQLFDENMEQRVAASFAKHQQEHEAKLAAYAAEQREAMDIDRHKSILENELERALSRYKHIDRESLLAAAERRPKASLVDIAKALDEQFARSAEAAGYARQAPPAPPAPVTVRAPGGSAPTGRHPYSVEGFEAYIKDFIASRGQ